MNNEIIKFVNGDLQLDVTVSPNNETVWLSANQMALLFDRDEKTIRKHINKFVSILITHLKIKKLKKRTTRKKCVLLELSNLFQNGTSSNGR